MSLYRITIGRITLPIAPYFVTVVLLCELCMQLETRRSQTGGIRPLAQAARPFAR